MKDELKIEIFGIVQGVNFRRRVFAFAEMLGVKGFVHNQEDGSVIIVAQGSQPQLEELLNWCQKAPFPVKLTGMSFSWRKSKQEYSKFEIKKDKPFLQDQAQSFVNLGKEVIQHNKNKLNVPQHVVIIPDGNRRWAKERGWKPWIGHRKATEFDKVFRLFEESKDIGVKYLTFWAFSTENWKRDKREVDEIFKLIRSQAEKFKNAMVKEEIRFRHMGRKDRLPEDVLSILDELEQVTAKFDKLYFQMCLDYNGRDDIVRAVKKMLDDNLTEINEETMLDYLDTKGIPDPDLIIRTSGERRTSGIMAYQAAYAELYFTNVYFPDFDTDQFRRAILDYSARNRSFGGEKQLKVSEKELNQMPETKEKLAANLV